MRFAIGISLTIAACVVVLWTVSPAAADGADAIKAGDRVEIHYTCRLQNGDVTATTEQSVADDASLKKSEIFDPRHERGGIKGTAGGIAGETPGTSPSDYKDFESQVVNELLDAIVGRKPGEYRNVDLRMKPVSSSKPGEHDLRMALVRHRPKEMRIPIGEYKDHYGEPEVGKALIRDPAIPGKIESVTDSEVVVKFQIEPGTVVSTPFGKGTIRDGGDNWEIAIDAQVGRLIRTGPIVGRISKILKSDFVIDFGSPFQEEPLVCDFTVQGEKSSTVANLTRDPNKEAQLQ
jgi:FKBP-type peptidyl-prolyl cis-trans isomerase 2